MISYEISINKLSPKHINDARYSYEVKVFNNSNLVAHSGVYGCTLTLWGARRKLSRELRRIYNALTQNTHIRIMTAQGSIEDLGKLV